MSGGRKIQDQQPARTTNDAGTGIESVDKNPLSAGDCRATGGVFFKGGGNCDFSYPAVRARNIGVKTFVTDVKWGLGGAFSVGCGIGAPAGRLVIPGPIGAFLGCYGGGSEAVVDLVVPVVIAGALHGTYDSYSQVFEGNPYPNGG